MEDIVRSREWKTPSLLHPLEPNRVEHYLGNIFLNNNLSLSADSVKRYYSPRNTAFATAIVDFIALHLKNDPPFVDTAGWGYGYRIKNGEMKWDSLIGYPVEESFYTLQEGTILRLVRMDLKRREFKVFSLGLWQETCDETPETRGVFVSWRLGYDASEPTDLDSR